MMNILTISVYGCALVDPKADFARIDIILGRHVVQACSRPYLMPVASTTKRKLPRIVLCSGCGLVARPVLRIYLYIQKTLFWIPASLSLVPADDQFLEKG